MLHLRPPKSRNNRDEGGLRYVYSLHDINTATVGLRWTQSTLINQLMYYVYILKCWDKTFYTGCTHDLEDRINRHDLGQIHYTKTRLPVKLHTYVAFSDKYKAYDFERYLKSGSGIAFRNKRLI